MVVTLSWMHSWAAVSISLSVLVVIVLFILYCVCWDHKKSKTSHQFYKLDESGLRAALDECKNENGSTGFFRRFSNASILRPSFKFSTNLTGGSNILDSIEDNKELIDSADFEKRFNDVRLQIESSKEFDRHDDTYSCISNDSHCTFFSVFSLRRANSMSSEKLKAAAATLDNM